MTLNCHIDSIEPYVGNMRMFEATGCGALLFTDTGANMWQFFMEDQEVIVYRSPEECARKIERYIHFPFECIEIAKAGQRKTLNRHTYQRRMNFVSRVLEDML